VLGPARAARAAPAAARTSSLAWIRSDGADSCIGGKELAEAVETVLGRRVFVSASAADVAVEGHVDRAASGAGWKATLRISGDHGAVLGTRELESPAADCHAMDDSLAFVIAVMIDPDAAARPQAPLNPPGGSRGATTAPPPATPASSASWQIAPRLGVTAAVGELPSVAWGATVGLRLGPPAVGVELLGSLFLPQDTAVPGAPGATVQFTWAYGGVALCPRLARFADVSLVGCAGALGGVLTATPKTGVTNAQESNNFVVLATARARLDWHVSRLFLVGAEAGADLPFARPAWDATSTAGTAITVFHPSAVGGEAGVAVGLVLE
jgi:hypothetical protein